MGYIKYKFNKNMTVLTRLIKSALLTWSLHSLEVQCGTVVETKGVDTLNNQINIFSCYTADCGFCDTTFWTTPSSGYWLSKFDAWSGAGGPSFSNVIQGVQLTYINALAQTVTSSLIGTSTLGTLQSYTVTKFVNGVSVKQIGPHTSSTKQPISCFILYFDDGTSANVGTCEPSWTEFKVVIDFNFVGLKCDLHQAPHGGTVYDKHYGCHVYNELGCPGTLGTFDSRSVNNMTVIVGQSSTQDVTFFIDQVPACGPRIYTFTPSYSFLNLSGPLLKTLTLSTANPADEGTYSVSMDVKLQNFPTITTTKTFSLTITCQVSTLTFNAGIPTSSIVRIGIDEPFLVSLPITKTPACLAVATFTISPTGLPFASIVQTGSTFQLQINGAVPSNDGLYSLTLTASQSGNSATKAFSLDLRDPCKTATIIATPNPLSTILAVMPQAGTQSQTFALTTDVTQSYPSVICNLVATITPTKNWISLSPDYLTIIVNKALIALPTELGTSPFSVTISSLEYPLAVSKVMNFDVQVTCSLTSFAVISKPVDVTYINNTGQAFSLPLDLVQQNDCKLPYTYTTAVSKTGSGITTPTWLIFDAVTRKYSFNVSAPSEIGVYDITITATTSQLTHQETFKLTIVSECEITNWVDRTLLDMSTTINMADDTQSLFFEDTVAVQQVNPTFCGLRTYTLSPSYPFLTILGDTLTLSSTDPLHEGTYAMTLTIKLIDFPSRPSWVKSFTVYVYCVIFSLSFDAGVPTTSSFLAGIDVQPFSTLPFSVTRSPACQRPPSFTVTPTPSFLSISTSTFDNGVVFISGATQSDHNTYSLTITATVDDLIATHRFILTIRDPCRQTKIKNQYIERMEYTIGQPATIQTFNQFQDEQAILFAKPGLCGERRYFLFGQGLFLTLQVPTDPWHEDFKLVLFTDKEVFKGEYQVQLQVRLNYPFVVLRVPFTVNIKMPEIGPVFKPNLISAILIQKTREPSRWVFELPVIQLDDPMDKLTIDVGGSGSAIDFVSMEARSLVIEDISTIPAGFSLLKLTLNAINRHRENSFQVQLTVKEAEPEEVAIPPKVLECDYSLKAPVTESEAVYQSGSFPIMFSWNRFEVKDANDDEECLKQAGLKVRLAVFTEDSQFATSNDWLHFSDATIDNRNEINFVTLSCDAFSGSDFKATVFVTASINEIKAEFKFSVIIKPGHKGANRKAEPPIMKLTKISEMGVARLDFDSPLIVFDKPFDAFMIEPSRFLKFEVLHNPKSAYLENPLYIDSGKVTSMTVKSFKPWQIEMQLEFSHPLYISIDSFNLDSLLVTILDETTFISAINFVTTSLKKSSSKIEMSRQMNKPQKTKTDQVDKTQDAISTTLTSSSLALNLILGMSLKFLWGMVNTLQFVIYMDKWKVNWPPNATVALATVRKIALGEFLDTDALSKKLLDFFGLRRLPKIKSGRQLEIAAAYSGPKSGRIVAVAFSFVALLSIIAALLYYALHSKYRQRVIDAANKTKQAILWNGVIRFYLQNFLKSSVAIATTYYLTTDRLKKPSAGSIAFMSLQALLFFFIVPILIYQVLKKNRESLSRSNTKQKIGSLYLGVRHREQAALLQVFEFLAFRLMFVVLTFTLIKYPGILVNCFMLVNNFNIIYVGWVKPFDSKSQNNLELANCWMLHLISYSLILLVNLLPGPEMEFNIGWVFIGLIGLIFAVNFCVILSANVREILWKLQLRKLKKEHEKRLIERAEEKLRVQETVQVVANAQIQQIEDENPNKQLIEAVLASNSPALDGSQVLVQIEEELARIDELSLENNQTPKDDFKQHDNYLISPEIPVNQQDHEEEKQDETLDQQERVFDKKYDQFTVGNNYDFFILRELQEKKDRETLAQPAQLAHLHLYQQDYGGSNLTPEQLIQNMFIPFKANKSVLPNVTQEFGHQPIQQVNQATYISRVLAMKRRTNQLHPNSVDSQTQEFNMKIQEHLD